MKNKRKLRYPIAEKPSKLKQIKSKRELKWAQRWEHTKASLRAKVEHPFRVIKRQFGYVKVRYCGLVKKTAQVLTLFALSNLWLKRKQLIWFASCSGRLVQTILSSQRRLARLPTRQWLISTRVVAGRVSRSRSGGSAITRALRSQLVRCIADRCSGRRCLCSTHFVHRLDVVAERGLAGGAVIEHVAARILAHLHAFRVAAHRRHLIHCQH